MQQLLSTQWLEGTFDARLAFTAAAMKVLGSLYAPANATSTALLQVPALVIDQVRPRSPHGICSYGYHSLAKLISCPLQICLQDAF